MSENINPEQNKAFRTVDFFTVVAAVVAVFSVIAPILKNHAESESRIVASRESQELAKDIKERLFDTVSVGRFPASEKVANPYEGIIGKDPWGESYKYKVIRNAYGQPTHVLVLSKGPNLILDTGSSRLLTPPESRGEFEFDGDDLGYVVSFNQ